MLGLILETSENGFKTFGLYPLTRNDVLRKLLQTISDPQVDQSMNETLISLLEEHHGQGKGGTKSYRVKRVEAGVIANRELLGALVKSSKEEEDDRTVCKIFKVRWINLTESNCV